MRRWERFSTAIKMDLHLYMSWQPRLKNSGMQAQATPTSLKSTILHSAPFVYEQ